MLVPLQPARIILHINSDLFQTSPAEPAFARARLQQLEHGAMSP
jgi:hypothetical protein